MITRTAKVASKNGLHARPAAVFARTVEESGHSITISFEGEDAEADSLLDVMSLGVDCGDQVTLSAEDDSLEDFLDELVTLLGTELD